MRRSLIVGCWLLAGVVFQQPGPAEARQVDVIRVDGVISPSTAEYTIAAIKEAEKDGAEALVIELDTPGGLDTSMRDIIKEILASRRPVVVFVSPSGARAASAGAFITIAAHVAAMAPATNIGSSTPVAGVGGELGKDMRRKVVNDAAAYMRTIAEQRGRNVAAAEKFVLDATNKTESEALKLKLIDLVSPSLDDLLSRIDGWAVKTAAGKVTLQTKQATIRREEMGLRGRILKVITDPTIAYLLFLIGLAGLYFEFSTPGAILPGVLGAIALILAFYAFQTLPINYAGLLLILVGIILFIAEIKVASHGILAIGGIVSMILGSIMLIRSDAPYLRISLGAIVGTAAGTAAFFILVTGAGIRALRKKPTTGREGLIGELAVARTTLQPDGEVFVRGELWRARADVPIEAGRQVRVRSVEGLTLLVGPVDGSPPERTGASPLGSPASPDLSGQGGAPDRAS